MRLAVILRAVAVAAALTVLTRAAEETDSKVPPTLTTPTAAPTARASARSEDENAIRQVVAAFVKAYNEHDAAAIGSLFTPEAQIADEDQNVTSGRDAIVRVFARVFRQHPETRIEDTVESIRFSGPATAVEDGRTIVTHDAATPPERNRYRVVHVKHGGKWQMASAADLPEDTWTGGDQLNQLEGLIGEWVNESPDSLVITSYRWTDNHRFILSQFTVQVGGRPAMTGTQRIGWDPVQKTIRSWVFDSEGGFGEGLWSHDGDKWVVKMKGTTRDGRPVSRTTIIKFATKDRIVFQWLDRQVGDEKLPDSSEITIVRKPPEPK